MKKTSGPSLYKEIRWFLGAALILTGAIAGICATFGTPPILSGLISRLGTSHHLLNGFVILIFLASNICLVQIMIDENKAAFTDRIGFYTRLIVILIAYVLFFYYVATPNWPNLP